MRGIAIVIILVLLSINVVGQDRPIYNHYFKYKYLFNPSFLSEKQQSEIDFIYRQQWVNTDGAPEYMHMALQLPLNNNIATGLSLNNFERGLLSTVTAMGSMAYTASIGYNSSLSLGISVGTSRTSIDINKIADFNDPALSNALSKSFNLEGQAGMNLVIKKITLGLSLVSLFDREAISNKDFQDVNVNPLSNTLSSLSYRFDLGPEMFFEPMAVYRYSNVLDDQIQGYGTFYYKDLLWLGGSYTYDIGGSMYLGFSINESFSLGYSYEFRSNEVQSFGNNSHEFLLAIKFGKKKVDRYRQKVNTEYIQTVAKDEEIIEEKEVPQSQKTEVYEKETQTVNIIPIKEEAPPIPTQIVVKEQNTTEKDAEQELQPMIKEDPKKVEEKEPEKVNDSGILAGYYVIVGVFNSANNARDYQQQLSASNHSSKVAYHKIKGLNYVYVYYSLNQTEANQNRDKFRKLDQLLFKDSWVMHIE